MSSSSPVQPFTRTQLYTETKRVLNNHTLHFLALSLLFFPLAFSLISFATTTLHSSVYQFAGDKSQFDAVSLKSLLVLLLYTVFVIFPAICGVAAITYSAYHGFYRKPVKISSSIKSLSHSFIPLLSTTIAGLVALIFISLLLVVSLSAVNHAVKILGFQNDQIWVSVISSIFLALTVIFILAKWGLAAAIVVMEESKWGFEALRRSEYLLKGMKSESLSIILMVMILMIMIVMSNPVGVQNSVDDDCSWMNWVLVLQMAAISMCLALLMVHYAAANAVLYVYCKAAKGEVAEMVEESTGEYVRLSIDDVEKESDPTQVEANNGNGALFFLRLYTLCLFLGLIYNLGSYIAHV